MRKTLYILIIIILSLLVMGYGMSLESESLLINGVAVLELVIPALTFMLTQIFILMFDKEKQPWIILGTGLAIGIIADLIAIGYYSLALSDLSGGAFDLALLLMTVTLLSLLSLTFFSRSSSRSAHHPKLKQ